MYSAYKKLTAQDIGKVPFNAHKQYSFDSSSFALNSLTTYDAVWSSASIETFSSGAKNGNYPLADTKNTLKYFQLEHLFYKDFKLHLNEKLGSINYLKHKRELYENVKVVSIPNGLCGGRIKPSSFYLSASNHNISGAITPYYELIDDSYGNLYISGSNLSDYNTDIRSNILKIGPEKGFKKYDLNVINDEFEAGVYYRRGKSNLSKKSNYSSNNVLDDSYFFNLLNYKDITFSSQSLREGTFSEINFNGSTSEIKIENDEKFHFNPGDDFTITLWGDISQSQSNQTSYLISKSTTKTVVPSPNAKRNGFIPTYASGALQLIDVPSGQQHPFEVYTKGKEVYFSRSDGDKNFIISASFTSGINSASMAHLTCRYSSSHLEIFVNGIGSGISGSETRFRDTQNSANLYIGNKGGKTNFLSGSLSQINIYNSALSDTQILNHYSSSNGSPYIGNVFYESGIATITHPNYQNNINPQFIGWNAKSIQHRTGSYTLPNPGTGSSGESNPRALFFKPDGTRVYVAGDFNGPGDDVGKIVEYHLSASWDLRTLNTGSIYYYPQSSSASLSNTNHYSQFTGSQYLNTKTTLETQGGIGETSPHGLFFKPDGSRLYFVGEITNDVYQYDLGTNWSVSSSIFHSSASMAGITTPRALTFKPDGTRLYVADNTLDQIKQFSLSTPWDITTAIGYPNLSEDSNADFSTTSGGPNISTIEGFSIKPDGRTLIILESVGSGDKIHEFLLDKDWSFTSTVGVADVEFVSTNNVVNTYETLNRGLFIRPDGRLLYTCGKDNDSLQQYELILNNNNFNCKFQGTHLIYEHEYQCTIEEHEFNNTLNISARKNRNLNCQDIANFATGSNFKPYVTTIGLYNEEGEMLVVGKLGQATRMSNETDTTFIIRWDR